MLFSDRADAGRQLADALEPFRNPATTVVAYSDDGVPVAAEVAARLGAPLEVLAVEPITAPGPGLAIGAVAEAGVLQLDEETCRELGLGARALESATERASGALLRRLGRLRAGRGPLELRGRTVLLVDAGLIAAAPAWAAAQAARLRGASRVVLAVPAAAGDAVEELRRQGLDVVALAVPPGFGALASQYRALPEVGPEQVAAYLEAASARAAGAPAEREVELGGGRASPGWAATPPQARGSVLLLHTADLGAGALRARAVAGALGRAGFATLRVELSGAGALTDTPEGFAGEVDARLVSALDWLSSRPGLAGLPLGCAGAGPGGAAALRAAALRPLQVAAVVAEDAPLGLVAGALARVRAPSLLVVSGDPDAVEMHCVAVRLFGGPAAVVMVGAPREGGSLGEVRQLTVEWMSRHLVGEGVGVHV